MAFQIQNADPPTQVAKSDYAINGLISFSKSEVMSAVIQRKFGLSKTILVGEKSLNQDHYSDGKANGDMLTMYVGDCDDIRRAVAGKPISDDEGGIGFIAHTQGAAMLPWEIVRCDL